MLENNFDIHGIVFANSIMVHCRSRLKLEAEHSNAPFNLTPQVEAISRDNFTSRDKRLNALNLSMCAHVRVPRHSIGKIGNAFIIFLNEKS